MNYGASNHVFKVNNRNTRTSCEIYSKLTTKTPNINSEYIKLNKLTLYILNTLFVLLTFTCIVYFTGIVNFTSYYYFLPGVCPLD